MAYLGASSDYKDWAAEYAAETAPPTDAGVETINISDKLLPTCKLFPDAFGCWNKKTIIILGAAVLGGYWVFKKVKRRK